MDRGMGNTLKQDPFPTPALTTRNLTQKVNFCGLEALWTSSMHQDSCDLNCIVCMCWHCCKIEAVLRCLQQTWEAHNDKLLLRIIAIISILQIRKQRHKEVKQLALYHTTNQWQKWDSRPKGRMLKSGHLFPEFLTSHLVLRCDLFHIGFFCRYTWFVFSSSCATHVFPQHKELCLGSDRDSTYIF